MNKQEAQAMQTVIDSLLRKLGLAKTCGAYHRGFVPGSCDLWHHR